MASPTGGSIPSIRASSPELATTVSEATSTAILSSEALHLSPHPSPAALSTPATLSPTTPRRTLAHSASLASFESVSPIAGRSPSAASAEFGRHREASTGSGSGGAGAAAPWEMERAGEEREENAREMSVVLGALMKCDAGELEAKVSCERERGE